MEKGKSVPCSDRFEDSKRRTRYSAWRQFECGYEYE